MPLRKVLGTKNPSDMMTKNVPCPTMELYLDMLNLKFIGGRAKIAQQLHSVGEIPEIAPLEPAHPGDGVLLPEAEGGQHLGGSVVKEAPPLSKQHNFILPWLCPRALRCEVLTGGDTTTLCLPTIQRRVKEMLKE